MRRRSRWLVGGSAATMLLLAGLGAYLSSLHVDAYRPWLEQRLVTEFRVPVTIAGGLSVTLGWSPVVVVRAVTLARPDGDAAPLARIDRVEARVALLPFVISFGRDLVVEHIAVQGARAWLGNPPAKVPSDAPHPAGPTPTLAIPRLSVKLSSLEMTDSVLHIAAGAGTLDVEIARASAVPDGDGLRFAAAGVVAGRAMRIDGSVGAIEQWLSQRQSPVAIDLVARIADAAEVHVQGLLRGDGIDLALRADFGGRGSHGAAPLVLSLRAQAEAPETEWRLADVMLELGRLVIMGDGALRPEAVPHLRLTLRGRLIDPPAQDGDDAVPPHDAGTPVASDGDIARMLSGLQRFTAEVRLTAAAMDLPEGVRLTDLRSLVVVHDGKAELREFAAIIAGGTITATGDLRAAGEFAARLHARNVDLGQLIRETRGASAVSGGRFALQADLRGRFLDGTDAVKSLEGRADLSVGRASVSNAYSDRFGFLQIFNLIDRALPLGATIAISCAAGRFAIADGVATTRGLMIDLPRLALWVTGRIDLRSQAINLRVEPQPKVATLISVVPPANIRGTLRRPLVEPDVIGTAVGVVSGLLSTPRLLAEEVGDVLSGIGDLVTGASSRTPRSTAGCLVSGRPVRQERPDLWIPNLLDLLR